MQHAYPHDLAGFLNERWDQTHALTDHYKWLEVGPADPLPDIPVLDNLLSACYQASLLRDEQRPVRFRLLLREPEHLQSEQGPPTGLHRLIFTQERPCNAHELRQLAPAADFYRSLIGVRLGSEQEPYIWGLVHSGPYWIQVVQGGRRAFQPLPASLVVSVTGPGHLVVGKGSLTIGKLFGGRLTSPSTGVFESRWLHESFAPALADLFTSHETARQEAHAPWAKLAPHFTTILMQRMIKQVVSTIRNAHHGGMLIFLPPERVAEFPTHNPYMTIKYPFTAEEPRQRFRTLVLQVMNLLAESYGGMEPSEDAVGWYEYMTSTDSIFGQLDAAIVEVARLIAGMASVDGAVVLTKRIELLGFGGEISGALVPVTTVARALDAEGERTRHESTESVGTRHRSAYRLCHALRDAMTIVISHDGDVRFVQWKDDIVTYWDQVATSALDV